MGSSWPCRARDSREVVLLLFTPFFFSSTLELHKQTHSPSSLRITDYTHLTRNNTHYESKSDIRETANMAARTFPTIKDVRSYVVGGVGSGGDYHNVKGGHWYALLLLPLLSRPSHSHHSPPITVFKLGSISASHIPLRHHGNAESHANC